MQPLSSVNTLPFSPYFISVSEGKEWGLIKELFEKVLVPLYGDQTVPLEKIQNGKDRKCLLLCLEKGPAGVIVYKTALSEEYAEYTIEKSLEIKTLFVIDAKQNSGKGIGKQLLNKICKCSFPLFQIHLSTN